MGSGMLKNTIESADYYYDSRERGYKRRRSKNKVSSNCKKTAGPSAPADPLEEDGYGSFSARRTPDVPGFLIL